MHNNIQQLKSNIFYGPSRTSKNALNIECPSKTFAYSHNEKKLSKAANTASNSGIKIQKKSQTTLKSNQNSRKMDKDSEVAKILSKNKKVLTRESQRLKSKWKSKHETEKKLKVKPKLKTKSQVKAKKTKTGSVNVRRSPRIKFELNNGKFLKPIYKVDKIVDFTGEKISVRKIWKIEESKNDLDLFTEKFSQQYLDRVYKNKERRSDKKESNMIEKKKKKIIDNEDFITESNSTEKEITGLRKINSTRIDEYSNENRENINEEELEDENIIDLSNATEKMLTQVNNGENINDRENNITKSDYLSDSYVELYNNPLFDHTNETVEIEENLELISKNLVRFHRLVDQKDYEELSKGVFAAVVSLTEGILRIDKLQNTIEFIHDTDIRYYIQKGYISLKLNDKSFLLTIGDSILIPKCNQYELYNPSKRCQAYVLFKFE